jgi:hypothetical protein
VTISHIDLTIERNSLGTSANVQSEVDAFVAEVSTQISAEFSGATVKVKAGETDSLRIQSSGDASDAYEQVRAIMEQVWDHGDWHKTAAN